MLDWLIVGGGPHGVHAALRLIAEAGVSPDAIRILDDEDHLLARWRRTTRNTGMRFLRSPSVHHLDLSSASLNHFASGRGCRIERPFTRPYARPSLELFDRHCDDVIERHALDRLHVRGRAHRLTKGPRGFRVDADDAIGGSVGSIDARRVLLALGPPSKPAWPDWAREASSWAGRRIAHLFDPGFELKEDFADEVVAVVGAGISGVQTALRLARGSRRVHLISRHSLRIHGFDSDPCWQGPLCMASFAREPDTRARRRMIRSARNRGSIPPDVHAALRVALAGGHVDWIEAELEIAAPAQDRVALSFRDRAIEVDRVLLATGFPADRPGGAWVDSMVTELGLPCAECGYPIVDRALRWHPGLFVTGGLAELELGPVARNLSGARRAADRLVQVAQSAEPHPAA
ncbi:MAG: FAD/NAD(P)-binding protein [Myxococcota bacterium]